MPLLLGLSLACASFLIVRALMVEGRAPASAWRDQTFGRERALEASGPKIRPGAAMLRSRSLIERLAHSVPRLQSPAEGLIARAGLSTRFTGAWLVGVSAAGAMAALLFWLIVSSSGGYESRELALMPVFALVSGVVPWVLVSGRGKRRQQAIERALPDTLDLLVVSIEAGLAIEGALQRVSERANGPLSEEIRRTLNEVALGRRRHDALLAMTTRTQVQPLQTLMNAINQAERSGMHMGPVMRSQAEQLRIRRRQIAQEKALKAPVKMLIPLALFIFPSMFLVILGPAAVGFFG